MRLFSLGLLFRHFFFQQYIPGNSTTEIAKRVRNGIVTVFILVCGSYAIAQDNNITTQSWFDFYPHFYLDEKLEYRGDMGFRFTNDFTWFTTYVRPTFRYHLSEIVQLDLGVSLFFEYNNDISNVLELRISQGIRLVWPRFDKIRFYSLIRYEQRIFYFIQEGWRNEVTLRFRYKVGTSVPLSNKGDKFWYAPLYVEFFVDIGQVNERFANRIRNGIGIGRIFDDLWKGELVAVFQRSDNTVENTRTSDLLLQLKVRKLIVSRDFKSKSLDKDIMIED